MKYGYITNNDGLCMPYFNAEDGKGNQYFKSKHVKGKLRDIAQSLGDLSYPRRFDDGQWIYVNKGVTQEESCIFSTDPIYVRAFLGAANHWHEQSKSVQVENP